MSAEAHRYSDRRSSPDRGADYRNLTRSVVARSNAAGPISVEVASVMGRLPLASVGEFGLRPAAFSGEGAIVGVTRIEIAPTLRGDS